MSKKPQATRRAKNKSGEIPEYEAANALQQMENIYPEPLLRFVVCDQLGQECASKAWTDVRADTATP